MSLNRRIAYVNLSSGDVRTSPIPPRLRSQHLGGRGLHAYLLYNHARPGTDALSPENVLAVGAGLLAACPVPGAAMTIVTTKSPLSGTLATSTHGGSFAAELRWAGFDHLVIKGRAKSPVFLHIEDGTLTLHPARELWGMDTVETREALLHRLKDPDLQSLVIGPAGERQIPFACAHTDRGHGSFRGGAGAVLGSKNLKAIAVRGGTDIELRQPLEALDLQGPAAQTVMNSDAGRLLRLGGMDQLYGDILERRLFRFEHFGEPPRKGSKASKAAEPPYSVLGPTACQGCPVACRQLTRLSRADSPGVTALAPGFEERAALGPLVGLTDEGAVREASHLCVRLGLDPLETGALIAWALELISLEVISAGEDLSLSFGNGEAILSCIRSMVKGEGIGGDLARGGRKAASDFGRNAADHLLHVKGTCHPPVDDRCLPSFALASAVSAMGADHRAAPWVELTDMTREGLSEFYGDPVAYDGEFDPKFGGVEGRARMVQWHENAVMTADSLGICHYLAPLFSFDLPGFHDWSEWTALSTGVSASAAQLWEAAERNHALERLFNSREGLTAKADWLGDRFFTSTGSRKKGARKALDRKAFGEMLEEYYGLRAWDRRGQPTSASLTALGLDKEPTYML